MLQVMVYDRAFNRKGVLGAWQSLTLNLLRNRVSECTLVAPANHPKLVQARASGARLVVFDDESGEQVFSGFVRTMAGRGPGDDQVTVTAQSDHRILNRLLAFPNPDLPVLGQTSAYYRVRGWTVERAIKTLVEANATRLGLPVSVAASKARGPLMNADLRFDPILEKMQPHLDASGLTVTMRQDGAGVVMDLDESKTIRRELTVQSGVLVSYEWSFGWYDGTRAIVGGQGEGAARTFRTGVLPAREAALGISEEIFVDARDIEVSTELPDRGLEKLMESPQTSGLSLELTETPSFRYGTHYRLGDEVTVETAAGPITDRIQQIQIRVDRDNGTVVTPVVGERSDDPDAKLVHYVKRNAGATSILERR